MHCLSWPIHRLHFPTSFSNERKHNSSAWSVEVHNSATLNPLFMMWSCHDHVQSKPLAEVSTGTSLVDFSSQICVGHVIVRIAHYLLLFARKRQAIYT
jgi:hypothetical protein